MLYFIENVNASTKEVRDAAGLSGYMPVPRSRQAMAGPKGQSGIVCCDESSPFDLRFDRDNQTWEPRFGFPGTYVGVWNDQPILPSDLLRENPLPGESIKLLDGASWVVPKLRQWREKESDEANASIIFGCELPTVLKQSPEDGRMVSGEVVRQYRKIWNQSCEISDSLLVQMQGGSASMDMVVLNRFVGDVLGMNYRIGLPEISLLGLLDEQLHGEVLLSALDWGRLREIVKKNRPIRHASTSVTSPTGSGETPPIGASTTNTDQPSGS